MGGLLGGGVAPLSQVGPPVSRLRAQSEADELRERVRLHLLHDSRSMRLDRLLTDAQVVGDYLARRTVHDERQHLALARRQTRQSLARAGVPNAQLSELFVTRDRLAHTVEQRLFLEGLLD